MEVAQLYAHAPCGLLVYQEDGRIIAANDTLLQLLGYSRADVVDQLTFQDLLTLGTKIHFETYIRPILIVQKAIKEISFTLRCKDGSLLPVLVNFAYLPQPDDCPPLTQVAIMEFAERKRYEREILLSKKRSAELVKELSSINAGLKEFAYVASHDLKAPLNTIHAYLEILLEDHVSQLNDDAQRLVQIAIGASERLRSLIQDILSFSQGGGQVVDKQPVDMNAILERVRHNLYRDLATRRAELCLPAPLPAQVPASETDMIRLFQNLISNAIKFVDAETCPRVEISVQDLLSQWQFSVSDNGIGIPQEQQQRIFEAFTRLHPHEQYSGNGIGLAACMKIVQQHGGQIWVESMPGQGSTFRFTLPKKG